MLKGYTKTLYTLCVDDYEPEITALTFPLMQAYANKIGAQFVIIDDREWPDLPPVLEKFQIHWKAEHLYQTDWNIFFDADTLIHPDMWDVTVGLTKDVTCSGLVSDFSTQRFKADQYFLRDGRFIGKGNWCAIFSDWCLDYYLPPDPMTKAHLDQLATNIQLTADEARSGLMKPSHLLDDYIVSRNIARFGLKHTLISEVGMRWGRDAMPMLFHHYLMDLDRKILAMQDTLRAWGIDIRVVEDGLCDH